MNRTKLVSLLLLLLSVPLAAANGSWVAVNGPYNDYVSNVLISKNGNPLVSTDSGGFASHDGCKTWTLLPVGGVNEFMMQRADGSLLASKSGTIYHADDAGDTWSILAKPDIFISHMVSLAAAGGEALVAAGKEIDTTWMGGSVRWFYKFYYSTDGGKTWRDVAIQLQQSALSPFANPGSPLCVCGGYVFMKNASGLYRAQDPAGACVKLSTPIPPDSIVCLASGQDGTMYCGAKGRIFSSVTSGNDWTETVFSDTSPAVYSLCEVSADTLVLGTGDGIYRMVKKNANLIPSRSLCALIVFDVKNASQGVVYAASGFGLFRSTDNGATWFQAGVVEHTGTHCIAVGKNDTLYAGTTRGVCRSADHGSTWSLIMGGLPNSCYHDCSSSLTVISDIAADPFGRVFMVAQSGRYYRLDNAALQWRNIHTQAANIPAAIVFDSKAHVFLGTSDGVWVSKDSGDHFASAGFSGQNIGFILTDRNDRQFISTESRSYPLQPALYRSTDTGATWQQMTPPLDLQSAPRVASIGPDNAVYIVISSGTIIKTMDLGMTWSKMHIADSTRNITYFRADESGVFFYGTSSGGLFSSSNNGATWSNSWTPKSTGYAYETIADSRGNLFLATWPEGVLKYTDYTPVISNQVSPGGHPIILNTSRNTGVIFDLRGRRIGFYDPTICRITPPSTGVYILRTRTTVRNVAGKIDR